MPDVDPSRRQLLGRRIREYRVARGLSVESASKTAGIARNTWRAAESGQPVQDGNLGRIERSLGWTAGSVLGLLDGSIDEPQAVETSGPDRTVPVGTGVDPAVLDLLRLRDEDDREMLADMFERLLRRQGE